MLRWIVVYYAATRRIFRPKLEKIKKATRKKSLMFWERRLSCSNIKKNLYVLIFWETETPKKILYFSGNGNPKKASYIDLFSPSSKKFLILLETKPWKTFLYFLARNISGKRNPEKILFISGNGTFLYFKKGIFRASIIHGIFETNSSFRLKQCTKGKVYLLFFKDLLLVLAKFSFWSGAGC